MWFTWLGVATLLIGYLLGSFPTAYIVTKIKKGIDIRDIDVNNMGAGAVFRSVGFWEGVVVSVFDIGKGSLAIIIAQAVGVAFPWVLGAGFTCLLGHCYPVYIGFKGGQGVATTIGVFLMLTPVAMYIVLPIIGIALLVTRHLFSSIAISAPFLPLCIWLTGSSLVLILYSLAFIAFIVFRSRHRLGEVRVTRAPPR